MKPWATAQKVGLNHHNHILHQTNTKYITQGAFLCDPFRFLNHAFSSLEFASNTRVDEDEDEDNVDVFAKSTGGFEMEDLAGRFG